MNITERARQAARDALADRYLAEGSPNTAELVRTGRWDDVGGIKEAIFGAEAVAKVLGVVDLLVAAQTVLSHVEDPDVVRVPEGQCTLCYSYRKLLRDAIAKVAGDS